MNEINKMKAEHARYKAALKELTARYCSGQLSHRIATAALNPPPPLPVTLEALQEAIIGAESRTQDFVAVLLNKDGSGNFRLGCQERRGLDFNTLQEALDMLSSDENLE